MSARLRAALLAAALFSSGCQSAGATADRGPSDLARPRPAPAATPLPQTAPPRPAPPGAAARPAATPPAARVPTVPGPGPVAQLPSPLPPGAPAPRAEAAPAVPAPAPAPPASELLREGEEAFRAGDLDRAETAYQALLQHYPGDRLAPSAVFRLGEVALSRGDLEVARRRFEELLVQFPAAPVAPSARYRLAYATFRLGRVEDAVELLKGLVASGALDPFQSLQATLLLSQGYEETRRPVDAARTYARLLAMSPPEDFRAEAERRLVALVAEDRMGRGELEELAGGPPSGASALARLRLSTLALRDGDAAAAERLARDVLGAPVPPGSPADLTTRAQAALDEALRHLGADPSVVGVVLPLSGRYQAFGDRLLHGLMLAAGVYSTGSPGDSPVRLVVRDSAGNPAAAARAVEELVSQERAIAVVGPLLNQSADEAAKAAQRLGVPLLALSQARKVTDVGPFVFRALTTGALQGRAMARQAMEREGLARFAILYPEDPSGVDAAEAFRDEVLARGGTIVEMVSYKPKQTDFGKEIRYLGKVKQAPRTRRPRPGEPPPAPQVTIEFDALFIPDYYDQVGLIAPQLAFYDVKGIRLLGISGWNSPDLVRLGREHVQGALFVDPFWSESPTPAIRGFVERFKAKFDEAPTVLEAQAFDALRLLVDTLRRARPASREALRDALAAVQGFPGLTGPLGFDERREPSRPFLLLTVENRRIRQLN